MVAASSTRRVKEAKSNYGAEMIPEWDGNGGHRRRIQTRTMTQWAGLVALGLLLHYQSFYPLSPKARAAALGLLFPGAGFIASANLLGFVSLAVTIVLFPLSIITWFATGAVVAPPLIWILTILGAYVTTKDTVARYSGHVALSILIITIAYFKFASAKGQAVALATRHTRNGFLASELAEIDEQAVPAAPDAERELSLADLRAVQYLIDEGLKDIDDWSNFTIIDQFQTSALRYQLYEMMYTLGAYQGIYTPNFHGYLSDAFRRTIEKSLTPKVLGFWKWEALWGKLTTNFDPIADDNIMVSGWFLQAIMLYTANTGDLRYTRPGSLKFKVTESAVYGYDLHTLDDALVRQWSEKPYCLFACEPNWVYTPCNMYGLTGQVLYDRFFKKNNLKEILPRFEKSLTTNFSRADGTLLPICSEIAGFTLPGIIGAASLLSNAMVCRGYLDHISRRMWAIFRHECINFDKDGDITLDRLTAADSIDPGNYKSSKFAIYALVACAASEHGDEKVRKAASEKVYAGVGIRNMVTGATALNRQNASTLINCNMVRSRLLRSNDWKNLISKGPSKAALSGPILSQVPYPGVLVAKARSHDSRDLEVVLYPSAESGVFQIGVSRLTPGATYSYGHKNMITADKTGEASLQIAVDGRTVLHLRSTAMMASS